jgi:hypothetical protein
MKTKISTLCIWSLILLLSGCNLPSDSASESITPVRAWFDSPLPGTVFAPPNPCTLVAHGASPNGIAFFELSVNGAVKANIPSPDTQATLVTFPAECGLSEPGEYLLSIRVQDNIGNWSNTAETNLTIASDELSDSPPEEFEEDAATPAPESTATLPASTATPDVPAAILIESVSTNTVYIGGTSCGTREVIFTVSASHPQDIKVIVLFYRFQADTTSEWLSISMNSAGGDLYQQTVNVGEIFGNSIPFDEGTMQYQAILQTNAGDTSTRTSVFSNISVLACGAAPACSSHNNQDSCEANGCNWNLVPGIVPLYACQNP